jgi:cytochrome c556
MRRILTLATAAMIAVAGSALVAQKVTTPAELDTTMKKIGPAQGATGKAINSGNFADAKAQLAIVKQALMDAENFWVVNKKDDAVAFSKDSIAKITALEQAVSAPMPDQQAALAALKAAGGTCGACHKTYRVQDENMQYILKPGTV